MEEFSWNEPYWIEFQGKMYEELKTSTSYNKPPIVMKFTALIYKRLFGEKCEIEINFIPDTISNSRTTRLEFKPEMLRLLKETMRTRMSI